MTMPLLALLPSPLLGPAVWRPVERALAGMGWAVLACPLPRSARTGQEVLDGLLAALPEDRALIAVAHSNAGAYVPSVVSLRHVVGAIFVDALLPGAAGRTPLAPAALVSLLRARTGADGLLPPWTQWWDDAEVAPLFPDAQTRAEVELEQGRVPISYFEDSLPASPGWDDVPSGYLAFGETYARERADAASRGWPVTTMDGGHLHMLINPAGVATELTDMARRLGW